MVNAWLVILISGDVWRYQANDGLNDETDATAAIHNHQIDNSSLKGDKEESEDSRQPECS